MWRFVRQQSLQRKGIADQLLESEGGTALRAQITTQITRDTNNQKVIERFAAAQREELERVAEEARELAGEVPF